MSTDPRQPAPEEPGRQEHDPGRDRWEHHVPSVPRDFGADRETRLAIAREASGEVDADGNFRHCSWGSPEQSSVQAWPF